MRSNHAVLTVDIGNIGLLSDCECVYEQTRKNDMDHQYFFIMLINRFKENYEHSDATQQLDGDMLILMIPNFQTS